MTSVFRSTRGDSMYFGPFPTSEVSRGKNGHAQVFMYYTALYGKNTGFLNVFFRIRYFLVGFLKIFWRFLRVIVG